MIKIEKVSIHGLEETIRGMRNPMNSWDKSDSGICKGGDDGIGCENCAKEVPCEHTYDHSFQLGKADHELMMKLAAGGPVHAKYRRMITVYLDIPYNYILEMICDWWAFSWQKDNLNEIFNWYDEHKAYIKMSPKTRKSVEAILEKMKEKLSESNSKGENL